MRHPTSDELAPVWAAIGRFFAVKRAQERVIRSAHVAIADAQGESDDAIGALKDMCGVPPAYRLDDKTGRWLDADGNQVEF